MNIIDSVEAENDLTGRCISVETVEERESGATGVVGHRCLRHDVGDREIGDEASKREEKAEFAEQSTYAPPRSVGKYTPSVTTDFPRVRCVYGN